MTPQLPPAAILETRTHLVTSTVAGEDYELAVWLPPSYATTTERYPVLYLLDSPYAFGLAWAAVCFRIWEDLLPELIVVGVGAPVQNLDALGPHPSAGLHAPPPPEPTELRTG